MAIDPAKASLPEAEGELQSVPMRVDLDSETAGALQRRADVRLARLFVRAANEDQPDYRGRLLSCRYRKHPRRACSSHWHSSARLNE